MADVRQECGGFPLQGVPGREHRVEPVLTDDETCRGVTAATIAAAVVRRWALRTLLTPWSRLAGEGRVAAGDVELVRGVDRRIRVLAAEAAVCETGVA